MLDYLREGLKKKTKRAVYHPLHQGGPCTEVWLSVDTAGFKSEGGDIQ